MSNDAIAVTARNRPAGSTTVHLAIPGADRALCGVWAGEQQQPAWNSATITCDRCWDRYETVIGQAAVARVRDLTDPERAVVAEAAAAVAGPPLVYMPVRDGHWEVFLVWSPLLASIVRTIPGARWDRGRRCWVVPWPMGAELARRLIKTGARVVTDRSPDATLGPLLLGYTRRAYNRRLMWRTLRDGGAQQSDERLDGLLDLRPEPPGVPAGLAQAISDWASDAADRDDPEALRFLRGDAE
jgi:hypothetical protein